MKTKSAKAKGRRACAEVKELLLAHAPELSEQDIFIPATSQPGEDIRLSEKAVKIFPFLFEVKNQESIQIWQAYKQALSQKEKSSIEKAPIVFFKRNRSDILVCLSAKDFLKLITERNLPCPSNLKPNEENVPNLLSKAK